MCFLSYCSCDFLSRKGERQRNCFNYLLFLSCSRMCLQTFYLDIVLNITVLCLLVILIGSGLPNVSSWSFEEIDLTASDWMVMGWWLGWCSDAVLTLIVSGLQMIVVRAYEGGVGSSLAIPWAIVFGGFLFINILAYGDLDWALWVRKIKRGKRWISIVNIQHVTLLIKYLTTKTPKTCIACCTCSLNSLRADPPKIQTGNNTTLPSNLTVFKMTDAAKSRYVTSPL